MPAVEAGCCTKNRCDLDRRCRSLAVRSTARLAGQREWLEVGHAALCLSRGCDAHCIECTQQRGGDRQCLSRRTNSLDMDHRGTARPPQTFIFGSPARLLGDANLSSYHR